MKDQHFTRFWDSVWKYKANPLCMMITIILYLMNQIVFKKCFVGEVGYFCNCFFNDLICQLFFLPYVQIFLIWVEREIRSYIGFLIVGMTAGLIWEFFAPLINAKAVTDIYDLICYLVGVHIYYVITIIEKKTVTSKMEITS